MTKIGVLALQGAYRRHAEALVHLGASAVEVRTPADLVDIDGLVIPGGESTTISRLIELAGLSGAMAQRLGEGMPALGTCAGMILLATEIIDGRADQVNFSAIDISVRRNAFGRQSESFEADLDVAGLAGAGLDGHRFPGVFIRAPVVERVGDGVEVLASIEQGPVLCRQGVVLVAAFHPELTGDHRVHELFLSAA